MAPKVPAALLRHRSEPGFDERSTEARDSSSRTVEIASATRITCLGVEIPPDRNQNRCDRTIRDSRLQKGVKRSRSTP
jgi:hypothetical protein